MKYFLLLCLSYFYLSANAHIFVFHRFGDDRHPSTNTTIEQLKTQFEYFKNNGYKVVPTSDIIDKLKAKVDIPDNWVAFHIDDSYKSFYENGLPLFKEYNYPFSLFVYVEATQKKYNDFMTWEQIKESSKYGEISLHSYSHEHLTKLSNEELIKDTKTSYEIFEEKMGFKPKGYVYPFGEYNEEVKQTIKSFGFDYIGNQNSGSVNKNSDIYDLDRVALVGKSNLKEKLKYKSFDVEWIEPKEFPKDGILKTIKAKVDPSINEVKLYVSKYGWQNIKVKDGIITTNFNKKLQLNRNRIIIGLDYYTISTKLLIK